MKDSIITAASDGRIVGLLQQGVYPSLTTTPAQEQLKNFDLQTFPQAVTEKERDQLDEEFWSKIELTVKENGEFELTVSEPIALVKIDDDGERVVAHYISAKGHYKDGRITTTFTRIEPFEEIKKEDTF